MAIRELFARFTFAWDQSALGKISVASQRAEARVRGVAKGFDQAQVSATKARPAISALSAINPASLQRRFERAQITVGRLVNRLRSIRGADIVAVFNRAAGAAQRFTGALRGAGAAADTARAKTSGLKGALSDTLAAFGVFGGVLGGVFAGRALVRSVQQTFDQVDATAKLAKQLGVTAEAMQALDAAAKLSGISVDELRVGFTTMTRNLGLFAATGEGRAVKILKEMGIEIDDIEGRKPDQLFWQFGKAIAGIEDPVKRSAFAQRIFGESGAKMLSLFRGSAADIDALKKRTEELGIVFSDEFAAKIEKTNDEMHLAGLQFQRIKVALIGSLAPGIMWIAGRLIHLGQTFQRVAGQSNILQAAFGSAGWMLFVKLLGRLFGGVGGIRGALAKLWPTVLRLGRILLPWIAWTLILDDIITFLQGGDSVLGRFLDTMFGAGTAKQVLKDLQRTWADIVVWLKKAVTAIREWAANATLGEKATAAGVIAVLLLAAAVGKTVLAVASLSAAWLVQIARVGATAAAWASGQIAAIAFSGSLGTMALAAGAAAGAVLAVWAAVDQFKKLLDEVGGWEGLFAGAETLLSGEGFFAGIDETANRKAKAEARAREAKRRAQQKAEGRGEFGRGTRAAPEPTLPRGGGSSSRVVTINDQRTTTVQVSRDASPAQTARAVQGAVSREQRTNVRALRGALVGAEHG